MSSSIAGAEIRLKELEAPHTSGDDGATALRGRSDTLSDLDRRDQPLVANTSTAFLDTPQRPRVTSTKTISDSEQAALVIGRRSPDEILAALVVSDSCYRLTSLDGRLSLDIASSSVRHGVNAPSDSSSPARDSPSIAPNIQPPSGSTDGDGYVLYIPDENGGWRCAYLPGGGLFELFRDILQSSSDTYSVPLPAVITGDVALEILRRLAENHIFAAVPPTEAITLIKLQDALTAKRASTCGSRTLAGSRYSGLSYATTEYDPKQSEKENPCCIDIKDDVLPVVAEAEPQASASSKSARSSSIAEKSTVTPDKNGPRLLRHLRFQLLSIYRRLFSLVFLGNLTALFILLIRKHPWGWPRISDVGTAVSANLAVTILIRQEHVVNLLFSLFCSFPLSAPLWIRKWSAKIYHLGGVHSGCAIAALCWYLVLAATVTRDYVVLSEHEMVREPAVIVVTYLILALLIAIILTAVPQFRFRHHNGFEAMHRFGGWGTLVLLWLQVLFLSDATRKYIPGVSLGHAVATNPSFWLILAATCSIIYPWLRLRHVTVRSQVLSDHALQLDFNYTTSGVGSAVRLSDRPLKEWHAFAAFSKPDTPGFSVVVSNAGDWTRKQIERPPSKMWVRGIPTSGVLRVAIAFKRIVLVATGSGIGPCLSVIYSRKVPCRVLWSTPHPLETFGSEITKAVTEADPDAVIHNTRSTGKPDMVALAYKLYVESQAEAVVVISNPTLTKKVVYGMESRGVPAYGPIWDS